jgi:hypothetical protein
MVEFEFVSSRKEVAKISARNFFYDCLEEYLPIFQKSDITRKNWTVREMEIFIRKTVSNHIVKNEFDFTKGRKKLTKKTVIGKIYEELGLPPLAITHIYDQVWNDLEFDSTGDCKNFILVTIYNDLDQLDIAIESTVRADDKAVLQAQKIKLLELLAKSAGVIEKKSGGGINLNLGNQAIDNSSNKQSLTQGINPQDLGSALRNLLPSTIEYTE